MTYEEAFNILLNDQATYSSGELIYKCPLDQCADYSKRKLYVSAYNGLWYCHHCNNGGSYSKLCNILGKDKEFIDSCSSFKKVEMSPLIVERSKTIWNYLYSLCSLQPQHRLQILDRGLDPDRFKPVSASLSAFNNTVAKFGLESCIEAGIARTTEENVRVKCIPTLCCSLGRILLPYWCDNTQQKIEYFVGYQKVLNNSLNIPKVANIKYHRPIIYTRNLSSVSYTVITEGLFKAEAAIQHGVNCIGLPGIAQCHKQAVTFCVENRIKSVYICFDNEPHISHLIEHQEKSLAYRLIQNNILVYKVLLPLVGNEVKQDIDSYILKNSGRAFKCLLKNSNSRPFLVE